jgi:hypothetical protein
VNFETDNVSGSGDPKRYYAYDERWRIVAVYQALNAISPREQFVHHGAGVGG